jgi:hypothetical protein
MFGSSRAAQRAGSHETLWRRVSGRCELVEDCERQARDFGRAVAGAR